MRTKRVSSSLLFYSSEGEANHKKQNECSRGQRRPWPQGAPQPVGEVACSSQEGAVSIDITGLSGVQLAREVDQQV